MGNTYLYVQREMDHVCTSISLSKDTSATGSGEKLDTAIDFLIINPFPPATNTWTWADSPQTFSPNTDLNDETIVSCIESK